MTQLSARLQPRVPAFFSVFFWVFACALIACLMQPAYAQTAQTAPTEQTAQAENTTSTTSTGDVAPNPLAAASSAAARTLGGGLSPQAERSRIQAERARLDALFVRAQAACYQKFAVENCQSEARVTRREALADLRRQEVSLNAAQARLAGAQQLSRIDSKTSTQAERDSAAQRIAAEEKQQARLAGADVKAASRAAAGQGLTPGASSGVGSGSSSDLATPPGGPTRAEKKAQSQGDPAAKARAAALNQKRYDEKQKQAQLKAAQRRKRVATGPAAPA